MQQLKLTHIATILSLLILASCAKPLANFTYDGNEKIAPAKVEFKNNSEKAETYEWDFGDGQKSTEVSPNHEYKSSGNYTVILKAKKGTKESVTEKRLVVDAPEDCLVEIETTEGTMTVLLYNTTPKHRDNFIKLAEEGFYNGLLFHRVINGFMVQGGDPESKNAEANKPLGSGGPGYQVPAEFHDDNVHVKGALAAARTGDNVNPKKKSSGSQFYIVHGRQVTNDMLDQLEAKNGFRYSKGQREEYLKIGGTPFLDRAYTVFGRVIKGMEVIDKIAAVATNPSNRPKENVVMQVRVVK